MKLFGNGVKLGTGILVGAGVMILAPIVLPVAVGVFKSVAKATAKGGFIAYEKAKVATAEAMESLADLAAEAKAEIEQKPKA